MQAGLQALALLANQPRLLVKHAGVLQREERALNVQAAQVVGRAGFVNLADQVLIAHQIAHANAGQAEFAQGAHHQHMRVLGGALARGVQPGARGKGLVRLVNDRNAACAALRLDQAGHRCLVPQRACGVVGV